MLDYGALLHDPAYTIYGTTGVLTSTVNPSVPALTLTVIDKTSGVEIGNEDRETQHAYVQTVVPGAYARMVDITTGGLTRPATGAHRARGPPRRAAAMLQQAAAGPLAGRTATDRP